MFSRKENRCGSLYEQLVVNYIHDSDQNEAWSARIVKLVRDQLMALSKISTVAAYIIVRQYGDALAEICRALPTPFVHTSVVFDTVSHTRTIDRLGKIVTYQLDNQPLNFEFPDWATQSLLLANLFVAEETRKRGVAKELIGKVVRDIHSSGKLLFATTSPDNIASQASFRSQGFQIEPSPGDFSQHIRLYRPPESHELSGAASGTYAHFDPFADLDPYGHIIGLAGSDHFDLASCLFTATHGSNDVLPGISPAALDALRRSIYLPSWLLAYRDEVTPRHNSPILLEVRRVVAGLEELHEPVAYVVPETLATYPQTFAWDTNELREKRDFAGHTLILVNPLLYPEQVWELLTNYWPEMECGRWFTIAQVSPLGALPGLMPADMRMNEQIVMMRHQD